MIQGKNLALTWHELPNGVMRLVPTEIHAALRHPGAIKAMNIIEASNNENCLRQYVKVYFAGA